MQNSYEGLRKKIGQKNQEIIKENIQEQNKNFG